MGDYETIVFNAFVGLILLFANLKVSDGTKRDEARLIHDLLKNYDSDARPVKNASEVLTVKVKLAYNQLQDLDEPTQVLHSLVWIALTWKDDLLRWNASDYGGQSVLNLRPSRIWTPDIVLQDNVKGDEGHISNEKFRIAVTLDGYVAWAITAILHSACPIDVSKFPFDRQKCKIKLASWSYDGQALDLQLVDNDGIDLAQHKENSEWKLKSVTSKRNSVYYKCCPAPFVDIEYSLEFERKALYYIMTIIIPSMLLSLLTCVSFLFPADSGERVSLVISVLLGLVVFMLIVNDRTPVTSDAIPMVTELFISIAATTVLALLATAFILRLNHVSSGVPVPRCLAKIRDCIAVAVCMKKPSLAKRVKFNFEEISFSESSAQYINLRDFAGQIPAGRKPLTEQKILVELQKLSAHLEEESVASEMKEDWHYTMEVFDRLFFVLFFIIFCAFAAYVFSFQF
ncbi:neuronal acetylcholine receptor subunit alpha-10-like [Paramuricea clavata]|uniref:Neuronal acetylcholine receptor subunit alpha-10-like n=1 Tax=Paramuricea clavata TaxID=317549 RepID=A0A6S7FM86_PARCT|nr:neuronal acetylcholine receptor subunit alpha-10-like [Paramuricea clavata]